jgi:chemosensory pili system protein ChpA (sensor histidine kinase/response regulator)
MRVFDPVSLSWCLPEFRRSLARVSTVLDTASVAPASPRDDLTEAQSLLRQVRGALELLDLSGETRLIVEVEAIVDGLAAGTLSLDGELCTRVAHAFGELLAHLDELPQHGSPRSALPLFETLQSLRSARRVAPASPAELIAVDLRGCALAPPPPARGEGDPPVSAMRTAYEKGLLQTMRDPASPIGPRLMSRAVGAVRASPLGTGDRAFWWVADTWFAGVLGSRIPVDAAARRVLTRLNLHLRDTLDGGLPDGTGLLREMLFGLALAPAGDTRIDFIREAFALAGTVSAGWDCASEAVADPRAMSRAREALARARGALDRLGHGHPDESAALFDAFDALRPALGQLPAPGLANLGCALAALRGTAPQPQVLAGSLGVELATAILFLEGALASADRPDAAHEARAGAMAERVTAAAAGRTDETVPAWLREICQTTEQRETTTVFVTEALAGLRTAESSLDSLHREGLATAPLTDCAHAVRQVGGALALLGHDVPAHGALRMAERIVALEQGAAEGWPASAIEAQVSRLADGMAALGFFVDGLRLPPRWLPRAWLDATSGELQINLSEPLPVQPAPPAPVHSAGMVVAQQAELARVAEHARSAEHALEADNARQADVARVADNAREADWARTADVAKVAEVVRFIDVAQPGAAALKPSVMPALPETGIRQGRPRDTEAVSEPAEVSRAPGTGEQPAMDFGFDLDLLSGGGSSGALADPEAAQPAAVAPGLDTPSSDSEAPAFELEAFEIDSSLLDQAIASQAPMAPPSRAAAIAPEASAAVEASGVDDELLGIFLEEADGVLAAIGEAAQALRATPSSRESLVELRRGFHTLKGSSRMVGLKDFGEAAWALEQLLNTWMGEARPVDETLLALVDRAAPILRGWVQALHEGRRPAIDPRPLQAAASALARGEPLTEPELDPAAADMAADALTSPAGAALPFLPVGSQAGEAAGNRTAPEQQADDATDAGDTIRIGSRSISRPLYTIFLSEADELIVQLVDDLAQWRLDPSRGASADAARAAHSLVGSSSVIGLDAVESLAGSIETAYAVQSATRCRPSDSDLDVLGSALDRVHAMLHRFAAGEWPLRDPRTRLELDFLIGRWSVPPEEEFVAPATVSVDEPAIAAADTQPVEHQVGDESVVEELTVDHPVDAEAAVDDAVADEAMFDEAVFDEAAIDEVAIDEVAVEGLVVDEPVGDEAIVLEGAAPDGEALPAPVADAFEFDDLGEIEIGEGDTAGSGAAIDVDDMIVLDLDFDEETVDPAATNDPAGLDAIAQEAAGLEAPAPALEALADDDPGGADAIADFDMLVDIEPIDGLMIVDEPVAADASSVQRLPDEGQHTEDPPREDLWLEDTLPEALLPEALESEALEPEALEPEAPMPESLVSDELADDFADVELVSVPEALVATAAADASADTDVTAGTDDAVDVGAAADADADADADDAAIVDELDPDLLPVFIEEAADDIPRIGESLRAWAASPADPRLPQTLMRLLHTVKGSARMAGAMRLGQMLHDTETRVERLAAAGSPSVAQVEELLADTDGAVTLFEMIRQPRAALPPEDAAASLADAASSVEPADPAPAVVPSTSVQAAPSQDPAPAVVAPLDTPVAQTLVRVRADLLDRMVSEAGEVSIGRSRLDNELTALRQSLVELNENVGRLRSQLREIEIQADTQIQARIARQNDEDRSFDPLEFDRYTRFQELTRMLAESVNDVATVQGHAMRSLDSAGSDLHRQGQVLRDLQQNLMRARMVQFGSIADRLYRVIRQSAKETGKRVNLDLRGGTVEVDRSVLERMAGPIEHLLRNSVAHGIELPARREAIGKPEAGEIQVEVRQEGREIVLSFADDGAGLDLARIRERAIGQGLIAEDAQLGEREIAELIFVPGFSTAASVTELSGRGVGMDVVRMEVAALGGRIETETQAGQGTRFTVHLPLTLAVTQVVLLSAGRTRLAVPSASVEQVLQLRPQELAAAYAQRSVQWQGKAVPLFFLGALMQQPELAPIAQPSAPVAIVRAGHQRVAVHADELTRNQEVVVKSVGAQAARVRGVTGATVLGNGDIVLIANAVSLAQALAGESLERRTAAPSIEAVLTETLPPTVMVVDDSLTVRKVTQRLLTREGYQVMLARDGIDALGQLEDMVPDAMLLDIEMPRMDGFELLRHLRADARWASIPIVMITSRTADKHRNHALGLGVDAYLGKPYPEEELLALLAGFAQRRTEPAAA